MDSDPNASPINALPVPVILLALPIVLVEIAFQLGAQGFVGGPEAVGWRLNAVQDYGFFAEVFQEMLDRGTYPPEHVLRFVTYPFMHWSMTHMLMVLVFLLALGKLTGELDQPGRALHDDLTLLAVDDAPAHTARGGAAKEAAIGD